jgi:hypothetical protein
MKKVLNPAPMGKDKEMTNNISASSRIFPEEAFFLQFYT